MNKWALALGPEVIENLHKRVVTIAQEKKVVEGRKMRVDTTVVETNIHYPTDSSLLGDGVRVLTRAMKRRQLTGVPASSSSDCVSAHGHRTGTHAAGGGAAPHSMGASPKAATQRPARIHIRLEYDIPVAYGSALCIRAQLGQLPSPVAGVAPILEKGSCIRCEGGTDDRLRSEER